MAMKDIKTDIAYLGLLLVAFTLPFSLKINDTAIILTLLPVVGGILFDQKFRQTMFRHMAGNKIALLLITFSVLYVLSGLVFLQQYENVDTLLKALEKRTPFMAFPLAFAITPMLTKGQVKNILRAFFFGIILSSLILLLTATGVSLVSGSIYNLHPRYGVEENNFMYHRLGSYLNLHAVYYSSMVLLAFILVLVYSRHYLPRAGNRKKAVLIVLLAYLAVLLFLLKSATILIALILIILTYAIFLLYKISDKISWPQKAGVLVILLLVVAALGYRVVDKIGQRGDLFAYDLSEPGGGNWNAFNLRKAKWDIAAEAIKDHWLLGVGPGNVIAELDRYYRKHNFVFALSQHYNPHNQFLHSFLCLGVLGFIVISAVYLLSFYYAIKRVDLVWLLFMLGFTFFSMSESTLAVNKGIVFFTFFASFFSYLPQKVSSYFNE